MLYNRRSLQHSNIKWNLSSLNENAVGSRGIRSGIRSPCGVARRRYGLAKLQTKLCRTSMEAMPFVQAAAALAAETCKIVFQHRRWNCSSIDRAPYLTPDLTRATREQAYVYAVSAASLTYTMARACANGGLHHCTCASPPKETPAENFKWGGCGDNIRWGTNFAKRFVDTVEKYNTKALERMARQISGRRDNVAYDKKIMKLKSHIASVNLHNNHVGRRIIIENLSTQCKCHGVSGSCSIKTCWRSMPPIVDIGHKLLEKFTVAKEVTKNYLNSDSKELGTASKRRNLKSDDLIFLTKSPDYCTKDERMGSLGTAGRKCNVTSNGTDSCRQLCCGRGYRTVVEEKIERCQCKYYSCCYVKCKTCKTTTQIYECS
ncbi:wnt related [Holotrichia oblita]|uniref:Wnt related n=3 Tax=Holotrichia oblita TaxID=644536 RepID=A0ACB9TCA1_HOLOL|nr:wnt related [Holotrichia oblita]KAI4464404.1 wnt related [Holotrichia oblita]